MAVVQRNNDTRLNGNHGLKRCLAVGTVSNGWVRFGSSSGRMHFLFSFNRKPLIEKRAV